MPRISGKGFSGIGLLLAWVFGVCSAHPDDGTARPPWQMPSTWPDRVITTLAGDPASSFSVSWRTNQHVTRTIAQVAPASGDTRFDLQATTHAAVTESLTLQSLEHDGKTIDAPDNHGLARVHFHSVTFDNLQADTLYAYRVRGATGAWSPWRQLRTAPAADEPEQSLSFLFFGDAQKGIRSHITRTFDTARQVAPDARFAIHGGDLVNTAFYDLEWAQWFEALGPTQVLMPALPVAGNHDYMNFSARDGGRKEKLYIADRRVSPIWRPQFALPVEPDLPADLAETVYSVRYGNVLVLVLDSSGVAWQRQLDWAAQRARQSGATWTVVTMHHPLFSFVGGNEHPAARERRLALLKFFQLKLVDLVLTGHRHTYQRGEYGSGVSRFQVGEPRAVDTAFVVTATSTGRGEGKVEGWRRYEKEQNGLFKLSRWADNTPLFAVIRADRSSLRVRSIDAVGDTYDEFTLVKTLDGNSINDGEAALGATKTYSNTGPYREWDDLR